MKRGSKVSDGMSNYRWTICLMLFFATVVNYMDRQVLSLTWKDFIAPEFSWNDADYGFIAGVFSMVYSVSMLVVGRFVDKLGTRRSYLWAIGIWSVGACLHALCGILTSGVVLGQWHLSFSGARESIAAVASVSDIAVMVTTVSVWLFLAARCVLAIGESGNFPCAIKVIAEYFPKKDRGFATGVFNSGAQIGALAAPFSIPLIARYCGWEMSFLLIGLMGFIWMGFWIKVYEVPSESRCVNKAELDYINQDAITDDASVVSQSAGQSGISFFKILTFRQTWAIIFGRCLPDAVWWFLLFWAPAYISEVYGHTSDSIECMMAIFFIYLISMLSIYGGYIPTVLVEKLKTNPYHARMKAMAVFALFPLAGLLAMPLGEISMWLPVIIIGIICAAHQSWSANAYTVVSDMFPKNTVATVTGIGGMAGGIGSLMSNIGSGQLITYAKETNMDFLGYTGAQAAYMIIFVLVSVAYLISWVAMKILVPKYKLVQIK